MKNLIKRMIIQGIYFWGCLFYDKKYFTGRFFQKNKLSKGWIWILQCWYSQKIKGINRHVPWPVPSCVQIGDPSNIEFDPDYMDNFFSVGCYYQAIGAKLIIKRGTMIGPNVGLITANHDINDYFKSQNGRSIQIEENCWIGMNTVILPGVHLGAHTIVGAGSVVTGSVPDGHCILAGNPARKLYELEEDSNGRLKKVRCV